MVLILRSLDPPPISSCVNGTFTMRVAEHEHKTLLPVEGKPLADLCVSLQGIEEYEFDSVLNKLPSCSLTVAELRAQLDFSQLLWTEMLCKIIIFLSQKETTYQDLKQALSMAPCRSARNAANCMMIPSPSPSSSSSMPILTSVLPHSDDSLLPKEGILHGEIVKHFAMYSINMDYLMAHLNNHNPSLPAGLRSLKAEIGLSWDKEREHFESAVLKYLNGRGVTIGEFMTGLNDAGYSGVIAVIRKAIRESNDRMT